MSTTETSIHDVTDITVEPVSSADGGSIRWQRIFLHTESGAVHKVVAFLTSTANGLEPSLRRRLDDLPRQATLFQE